LTRRRQLSTRVSLRPCSTGGAIPFFRLTPSPCNGLLDPAVCASCFVRCLRGAGRRSAGMSLDEPASSVLHRCRFCCLSHRTRGARQCVGVAVTGLLRLDSSVVLFGSDANHYDVLALDARRAHHLMTPVSTEQHIGGRRVARDPSLAAPSRSSAGTDAHRGVGRRA